MKTLLHNYQIQELLPHRYPMLLVDQVVEFDEDGLVAIKVVSNGEATLQGHFPGFPIFPGVMLVEALAQTCALLCILSKLNWQPGEPLESYVDTLGTTDVGVLGSVNVQLLKPVLPGTVLQLHAHLDWSRRMASSLQVKACDDRYTYAKGTIIVATATKAQLISSIAQELGSIV